MGEFEGFIEDEKDIFAGEDGTVRLRDLKSNHMNDN